MRDFEYFRPETIDKALDLYKAGGPGAKILAGGTELVNEMRLGKTQPDMVIDLKLIQQPLETGNRGFTTLAQIIERAQETA